MIISDITLISVAVLIGTIASIVQQIHFAVAWVDIKEAQFAKAVLSLTDPSLAFGGAAQIWDVVLFYIRRSRWQSDRNLRT